MTRMANEKWLIDPEMLKTKFYEICEEYNIEHVYIDRIIDEIDDATTVEAVEVVHGQWIVCGDGEYVPFKCSACGKNTSWYHAQTANYCPNCGANMMDGDGNEP